MKTGRMKSDGMGEMGAFENELQWTIAFSGIGKKSGEWEQIFHTPRYLSTTALSYFSFSFSLAFRQLLRLSSCLFLPAPGLERYY